MLLVLYRFRSEAHSTFIIFSYVQNNGERAIIRPWVWIALLFIGPLLTSIVTQCYGLLSVSRAEVKTSVHY